jgi:hypothetical protein
MSADTNARPSEGYTIRPAEVAKQPDARVARSPKRSTPSGLIRTGVAGPSSPAEGLVVSARALVASCSIVTGWSNFRGGDYW